MGFNLRPLVEKIGAQATYQQFFFYYNCEFFSEKSINCMCKVLTCCSYIYHLLAVLVLRYWRRWC